MDIEQDPAKTRRRLGVRDQRRQRRQYREIRDFRQAGADPRDASHAARARHRIDVRRGPERRFPRGEGQRRSQFVRFGRPHDGGKDGQGDTGNETGIAQPPGGSGYLRWPRASRRLGDGRSQTMPSQANRGDIDDRRWCHRQRPRQCRRQFGRLGERQLPESFPRATAEPSARGILRQLRAQFDTVPVRRVDHPPCSRGRSWRKNEVERDPRAGGTRKCLRAHQGVTGNAVADDRHDAVHRPPPGQRSPQGAQRPRVSPGSVDENRAIPRRNGHRTNGRWIQAEAAAQIAGPVASHYQDAEGVASRQPAGFGECPAQPDPRRWVPSPCDPGRRRQPRGPLSSGAFPGRVGSGPHQPNEAFAKQHQHLPQHPQGNEENGQRKDDQNDQDDDLEHASRQ